MFVKHGDAVKVHYTGMLEDNSIFDSSLGQPPLEFTIGEGQIIPGFEQAVIGMRQGDSKAFTVLADGAYGQHHAELVFELERERIPQHSEFKVGQELLIQHKDGRATEAVVVELSESSVTLDANHPLAGKDLMFEIELIEISQSKS